MAYCRWSSDNFKSDVYTYEDVNGGWTTHVAGRRRVGLETLPENPHSIEALNSKGWKEMYKSYHEVLNSLEMEKINLPHAGETFHNASPKECADTLRMLKGIGYHVPDGVIEELEAEEAANPEE